MKKILLLTTELHRPVGGLYRYVTELLPSWRNAVKTGQTTFEPLVWSLRDSSQPLGDLKPSAEFEEFASKKGFKIYEALRGGEKCFFLESSLNEEQRNAFHKELWDKYRVKSERVAYWDFYQKLNAFWKHMPDVAQHLVEKGEDISAIDAQDWLDFPAGFLCKERIKKPLLCRFHSGEFGRSLGKPDFESPALRIEAMALAEADYVQGVSISEAKYEVYKLLSFKQKLVEQVKDLRPARWLEEQRWKDGEYEKFVLLETDEMELVTQAVAGVPNGIILEPWRKVSKETIERGRSLFNKLLPGKNKYVMFIGRAEWRKGIDHLLEGIAMLKNPAYGLVVFSSMTEEEYRKYSQKIADLGIQGQVIVYNGWIDEDLKKGLLCSADAIALPSLYEPFGLVTLEGLAADLACENNGLIGPVVVVGDTGGMHELVKNGVNGFKIPMEEDMFEMDPRFLSKVLEIVLTDEHLRHRISIGGAERSQLKYFDWNYIALRIMELHRKADENYAAWHAGP
jgi:glycogen(starch) synthase